MKDEKKHIEELEKTAEYLRERIEKALVELEGEPLTVEYDHGGGQSGVRENPAYTAFEKMVKSYQGVLTQLVTFTGSSKYVEPAAKIRLVGNSKWKKQA